MAKKKQTQIPKPEKISKTINQPLETVNEKLITEPFFKNNWWKILLLGIFGFIIYAQTYNYGYVLDDAIVITDNSFTKKGIAGIDSIMTTESMVGYFKTQRNLVQGNRYRPLSLVTFAIETSLFGQDNAGVRHIINLLLYILSSIIIMRAVQILIPYKEKIFGVIDLGFLTALIFLVHPIHVEAVANIKGRDEIMATMLSVLTLYLLTKYYVYKEGKKFLWLGLISFFLALLSKENSITFVAVIPLAFYFFSKESNTKSISSFLWLCFVSMIYLILRFKVSGVPKLNEKITDIMNNPFVEMTSMEKIATIFYTLIKYIKLLFIPYPLTHDYYPYAIPKMNFGDWQVILAVLFYLVITYLAFKSFKSKNIGGFSILYYLITLTIVSNFVINIGTFMNDRFIYMPSLGFCLLLAWAILYAGEKIKFMSSSTARLVLAAVPILIFTFLSFIRVPDWKDALSLNSSAVKVSPNSARANVFMSTALFEEAKKETDYNKKMNILNEAFGYAKRAIEIIPRLYNGNLMFAGIAGEKYQLDKNLDALLKVFEVTMSNNPEIGYHQEYLNYLKGSVDSNKLKSLVLKVGQNLMNRRNTDSIKWAIQYMKFGLELDPNDQALNKAVGDSFMMLGDQEQAAQYLNR